jgi:hypothetical protein
MVSTDAVAVPRASEDGMTNAGGSAAAELKFSPAYPRSASRNVLDLTGAAIATVETPHAEQGNDPTVLVKREAPSISLPRQSTDVRHFAMGRCR